MKTGSRHALYLAIVLLAGGCSTALSLPQNEEDGVHLYYYDDWKSFSLWYWKSPEYDPAYPIALIEPLFDVYYCYPEFERQFDEESSVVAGDLLTDELFKTLQIDSLIEIGWSDENLSLQGELAMTQEYCESLRWRPAPDSLCSILLYSGYRYGMLAYGYGEFSSKKAGYKSSTVVITIIDSIEKKFLFSAISDLNKIPTRPKSIRKQVKGIAKVLKTPVR